MSDADRYHAVSALQADLKAAEARAERAEAQLARQNETNRRLHTRCQIAEKAARDNVDACLRKGISLSRGLSHFAYLKAEERAKEAQTEIARLQMQVDAMCDAESLRQEREARKRAEAEVARLTHELSVATNWVEHHSQHASDLIGELARLREPNCTLVGFDATDRTLTVKMDGPIMDVGWRLCQRAVLSGEGFRESQILEMNTFGEATENDAAPDVQVLSDQALAGEGGK